MAPQFVTASGSSLAKDRWDSSGDTLLAPGIFPQYRQVAPIGSMLQKLTFYSDIGNTIAMALFSNRSGVRTKIIDLTIGYVQGAFGIGSFIFENNILPVAPDESTDMEISGMTPLANLRYCSTYANRQIAWPYPNQVISSSIVQAPVAVGPGAVLAAAPNDRLIYDWRVGIADGTGFVELLADTNLKAIGVLQAAGFLGLGNTAINTTSGPFILPAGQTLNATIVAGSGTATAASVALWISPLA